MTVFHKALSRVLLFVSLYGFGYLAQPRQTGWTGTQSEVALWSAVCAVLAVIAVSLLVAEIKSAARATPGAS